MSKSNCRLPDPTHPHGNPHEKTASLHPSWAENRPLQMLPDASSRFSPKRPTDLSCRKNTLCWKRQSQVERTPENPRAKLPLGGCTSVDTALKCSNSGSTSSPYKVKTAPTSKLPPRLAKRAPVAPSLAPGSWWVFSAWWLFPLGQELCLPPLSQPKAWQDMAWVWRILWSSELK